MSCSKIISIVAVIILLFGISTIDYAAAAEKAKCKSEGTFYSVKWEQIEVGDGEGHMLAVA